VREYLQALAPNAARGCFVMIDGNSPPQRTRRIEPVTAFSSASTASSVAALFDQ
jgi:hypothetical protein